MVIDIFITRLRRINFDYAVYGNDTDFVFLNEAYKQKKITKDDLKAIASKEAHNDHSKPNS